MRKEWDVWVCVAFAVAAFLLIVGPGVLDVQNIAWIKGYDPPMFYLGWIAFRNHDWTWPLAQNPDWGLEFSRSVLFADCIPLLAVPLKAFRSFMPANFQYFGWWFLACFILQAVTAWKLCSTVTRDRVARLLGAVFFVFAPPLLARMADLETQHYTLVAQWQILAALYLCLARAARPVLSWAALIAIGVMTHPYLLSMTAALWIADVVRRDLVQRRALRSAAFEVAAVLGCAALPAWGLGLYPLPGSEPGGSLSTPGSGWFNANLLTPINANGWSFFWPKFRTWGGASEGFAFFGVGGLLLIAAAIAIVAARRGWRVERRYWPFAGMTLAMAIYALSVNVSIGEYHVYAHWPKKLLEFSTIFRASGRYVWPLFYLTLCVAFAVVARFERRKLAGAILGVCAVVQIIDTEPGWSNVAAVMRPDGRSMETTIRSSFWPAAAARYEKVRIGPPEIDPPRYADIGGFAISNRMGTDAVHIARETAGVRAVLAQRLAEYQRSGVWPTDTLYLLDRRQALLAAATLRRDRDLLSPIDGFYVLAPGWMTCLECPRFDQWAPTAEAGTGGIDALRELPPPDEPDERLEDRPRIGVRF